MTVPTPTSDSPGGIVTREVGEMLDTVGVPACLVDADGAFVWINRPLSRFAGRLVGRSLLDIIPPAQREAARMLVSRRLATRRSGTDRFEIIGRDGRRIEVLARWGPVIRAGAVVAVFGVVLPVRPLRQCAPADDGAPDVTLTPRQMEVLGLLAEGLDTVQIARRLGIARETTRNHIRLLLGRLGAHTRLEALLTAWRLGLVDLPPDES